MVANPWKLSACADFRTGRFAGIMIDILSVKHLMSGVAGPMRDPREEVIR